VVAIPEHCKHSILFIILPKSKTDSIILISSLNAISGGIIGLRQTSLITYFASKS